MPMMLVGKHAKQNPSPHVYRYFVVAVNSQTTNMHDNIIDQTISVINGIVIDLTMLNDYKK